MAVIATSCEAFEFDGLIHCGLIYWIAIPEPVQVDGRNAVPTPASEMPERALRFAPRELLEALHRGTLAYELGKLVRHPQEPENHFGRRVQTEHTARSLAFLARYRDRWGSAVDSPGQPQGAAERRCETCGGPLVGRRWDTHYCSNACRQKAYRERRRAA